MEWSSLSSILSSGPVLNEQHPQCLHGDSRIPLPDLRRHLPDHGDHSKLEPYSLSEALIEKYQAVFLIDRPLVRGDAPVPLVIDSVAPVIASGLATVLSGAGRVAGVCRRVLTAVWSYVLNRSAARL